MASHPPFTSSREHWIDPASSHIYEVKQGSLLADLQERKTMILLADIARGTSTRLFRPPTPVRKDSLPVQPVKMSAAATSTPPDSIRAALLRPQLGLDHPKGEMSAKTGKHHELPLPPAPEEEKEEEEEEASSVWISVGVSAISLLGSAVVGVGSAVGSAALSVLTSSVESESRSATKTEAVSPTASETTLLGSMSATISGIASSTIDYATGGHTPQVPSSPSAQAHDAAAKKAKRASTLPIQLTATGEPFSSDPSISAMQRIPDHACGHTHHRQGLTHCCSAPDVLASAGSVEEGQCRCKCTEQAEGNEDPECECICHAKTKGQSGHFHRVEQLVKGTKRVVRDIKNVL